MKKKLIAMGLVVVLTLSMSFTALAAGTNNSKKPSGGGSHSSSSSSDDDDSSSSSSSTASSSTTTNKNQETTVANAVPGGRVAPSTVSVAVVNADGTVSATNLGAVISATQATVAASAVSAPQAVATVQALMTTAPLATMKGAAMVVNNCGTVKTAAVAADALGNNIASAGVIPNVTSGALVMLMSVNADGTVEYVEGVVDPVTGAVLGAFKGIPTTITVLVFA